MLPLVQRIVEDIIKNRQSLASLLPEMQRLDRQRRVLAWPERARRYQLREDVSVVEHDLQDALAELEVLGVALLDADRGHIGFPTLVNNKRAFFSWRLGEDELRTWHFVGESARRPIPPSWTTSLDGRRAGSS
jgi:hypothetical protein